MKKFIFTSSLLLALLFQGYSQISLNHWDVSQPLTKYLQYNDSMPLSSIQPGTPGANKSWDFSLLQHHTTDTMIFTNSQWTPYFASFPASNLCMFNSNSSDSYLYFITNNDSLTAIGQAGNFPGVSTPIVAKINPSRKLMDFPSTYQDAFTNTSSFTVVAYYGQTPIDSIKFKDIATTTNTFDAWGSLTTGIGVFNCLRKCEYQTTIDSIWVKNNYVGVWMPYTAMYDTSKTYSWWAKNVGFVIAELNVDPVSDSVLGARYLGALPQPGGVDEIFTNNHVIMYPNPASETIYINSKQNMKSVYFYNSIGELVKSSEVNGLDKYINITDLSMGVYFIRITSSEGATLCNKKLFVK